MKKNIQQGMTLIELIIALAILGILGIGILGVQYALGTSQVQVWRNLINVDEANENIAIMVREIRNSRPGDNGAYPFERAEDHELIFYSDIDYDGISERVRYTHSDGVLVKGVIEPTGFPAQYPSANEFERAITTDIKNGSAPVFYFYNSDWPANTTNNPLDTPTRLSDTKLIKVNLILNSTDDPDKDFTLDSYVQIRSLKENL